MVKIVLSDFVEVIFRSGSLRASKIREIKYRDDYSPMIDLYKPLREQIVRVHKANKPKNEIDKVLVTLTDKNKKTNYPSAIVGYKKWLGRKVCTWFNPPSFSYIENGVQISVNPELGLEIDGIKYVIKLYFKSEGLTKSRAEIITALLETALRNQVDVNTKLCILDVRRSKLYEFSGDLLLAQASISAELSYIASVWSKV